MLRLMLIGNLVRDPESRTTKDGIPLAEMTVAVNYGHDKVDYIKATAWRRQSELALSYLHKGSKVYLDGRPTARGWQGRDGTIKCGMELQVETMEFLTPRSESGDGAPQTDKETGMTQVDPEDLPY